MSRVQPDWRGFGQLRRVYAMFMQYLHRHHVRKCLDRGTLVIEIGRTVPIGATMPNMDELLWPGTLVTAQLTFWEDEAVAVPSTAMQVSQSGSFVFVLNDGIAKVQPVKVARVMDSQSILEGGELVVTEGHVQIIDGSRVSARETKAGS